MAELPEKCVSDNVTDNITDDDVLLKGKAQAAENIKLECLANDPIFTVIADPTDGSILSRILHLLLNPTLECCPKMTDWVKWLVAGGLTPSEFRTEMKKYDNTTACGKVWKDGMLAFRCKTCSVSPSMSLCSDCFKNGDHEGHDFHRFKSEIGGICDCGNSSVIIKKGFCSKHSTRDKKYSTPPRDLTICAEAVLPSFIHIFIIMCRKLAKRNNDINMEEVKKCFGPNNSFFVCLEYLLEFGGAMRTIIKNILLSKKYYQESLHPPKSYQFYYILMIYGDNYLANVKKMYPAQPPNGYEDIKYINHQLVHETLLDEIMFWMVKFEFPRNIICFLLNMRQDPEYEKEFARAFIEHYSRISKSISTSKASDPLCNKIVHISVQLFSERAVAYRIALQYNLLYIIIFCIRDMIADILGPSDLYNTYNDHLVVDCNSRILKNFKYYPLTSDLNGILSQKLIATLFIKDSKLFNVWHSVIGMFQGMNISIRGVGQYIAYQSDLYLASFRAESEACAAPMWTIAAHLIHPEFKEATFKMAENWLKHILMWLRSTRYTKELIERNHNRFSFHIPLHRNYAILQWIVVKYHNMSLKESLPEPIILDAVTIHPLIVLQAVFSEIICGKWSKTGNLTQHPAAFYAQSHFSKSMLDADIFFVQLSAMKLPPDALLDMIIRMFNMSELLYISEDSVSWKANRSKIDSFLIFLAALVSNRTFTDEDDSEIELREMTALLAMRDRTHSNLVGNMPEKSSSDPPDTNYDVTLEKLAVYNKPDIDSITGAPKESMYHPKPNVWEHRYDPLQVQLRSLNSNDYHSSFQRFRKYCLLHNKVDNEMVNLWPPYRLPSNIHQNFVDPMRLLSGRTFQAMLLILLYNASNELDDSDVVLSLIVFLLELIVDYQSKPNFSPEGTRKKFWKRTSTDDLPTDGIPEDWFYTNNIFVNSTIVIHRIRKDLSMEEVSSIDTESSHNSDELPATEEYQQPPINMDADHSFLPADNSLRQSDQDVITNSMSESSEIASCMRTISDSHENGSPARCLEYTETETECKTINDDLPTTDVIMEPNYSNFDCNGERLPADCIEMMDLQKDSKIGDEFFSDDSSSVVFNSHLSFSSLSESEMEIDCSIISLLLKIHGKLTGFPGSYQPNFTSIEDSRIGDGAFFVAKLLNKLGRYSRRAREHIVSLNEILSFQPKMEDEEGQSVETEDDKKKSNARERRKKVLAHFAEQQKHFLEKHRHECENTEIEVKDFKDTAEAKYYCVICCETTHSTTQEPMGLITFAQSTSILSHRSDLSAPPTLPMTYMDLNPSQVTLFGPYMDTKTALLKKYFGKSAIMAISSGWEDGVHIQTCGHHLHIECHEAYLQTLALRHREKGEFMCPLCRHVANCFLPVGADILKQSAEMDIPFSNSDCKEKVIDKILKNLPIPKFHLTAVCAMTRLLESLKVIHEKCSKKTVDSTTSSQFMFVSSIIHTNLEIELEQRGCHLVNEMETTSRKLRYAHQMPLIYSMAYHSKILAELCEKQTAGVEADGSSRWKRWLWSSVTLRLPEWCDKRILADNEDVPILFRDPFTILLQLILLLPLKLELSLMDCVMNNVYTMMVIRTIANQLCQLTHRQTSQLMQNSPLAPLFLMVYLQLKDCLSQKDTLKTASSTWTPEQATNEVRENCLEFLRRATLLKVFSRQDKVPFISEHGEECELLEKFIGVFNTCSVINPTTIRKMCSTNSASNATRRQPGSTFPFVETLTGTLIEPCKIWCSELVKFSGWSQTYPVNLLVQKRFLSCRLLRFPPTYDELFQKYHQNLTILSKKFSRYPAICLVCGMLIYLRTRPNQAAEVDGEAMEHAVYCGAGTAIYLSILQSLVYVVRETRYLCWGSLHLDAFGEEDKDLMRGKSLFLNQNRVDLLEELWVSHRFDSIGGRWIGEDNDA